MQVALLLYLATFLSVMLLQYKNLKINHILIIQLYNMFIKFLSILTL
ncbi:hypothetical protein F929_02612 [Acinetobacter lactucae]|uniref:Uncharacterized protein n=1 Tax=Acinetobacter lactucae TaxID=1785128 RepID=R8YYQ2_9GAMM|nr:hypothetical protein F929_02612 [Acinetobacter lactucae]